MWTDDDENLVEHLAGVEDFTVAMGDLCRGREALARRGHHATAGRAGDRGQLTHANGLVA